MIIIIIQVEYVDACLTPADQGMSETPPSH